MELIISSRVILFSEPILKIPLIFLFIEVNIAIDICSKEIKFIKDLTEL